ncbi:aspartate carbamoyltransferase [Candidatus Gracilibacteria bacterium]|nr:aspartate carbamoyltransferase [Candidatus Gracilibacteria bacterium]
MKFTGSDILSAAQFEKDDILTVLQRAAELEPYAKKEKWGNILEGKLMASLFYEPSTRTRLSFETSMQRLGGRVISAVGLQFSSLTKGETLYDTGLIIENYADVIAMRHPDNGSVAELARGANIPVINAGDGSNEHPSQSLLDLFTIQKERGTLDGITVAMVGDLKFGRTVHSLSQMLSHFKVKLIFIAPDELKMPAHITEELKKRGIDIEETTDMVGGLKKADVVYMTRIQQERFTDQAEYDKHRNTYILTKAMVESTNPKMTIMHPLPRIWEITADVDQVPGAAYFRQVANGVAVRMALLTLVLGK